jgi:hypothetical protein
MIFNQFKSHLYLNVLLAEDLRLNSRGPARCHLDLLKEALLFRDGKTFPDHPELAFDLPVVPTDLLFVYSHAAFTLENYRSNTLINGIDRNAAIKRLASLKGAQRTLSSSNSDRCWDYLIIFEVLLTKHLSSHQEQIDVPWTYELLSRALMNDVRMDHILSRPSDFERAQYMSLAGEP